MLNKISPEIFREGGFGPHQREKVKFETKDHLKTYHTNAIQDQTFLNGITPEHLQYLDATFQIEKNKDNIEQHVDRRVQLFFMQLITCYLTPFYFEWVKANDQYGIGKQEILTISPEGKPQKYYKEASHSSTLPCLIAYPKEEWDLHEKNKTTIPKPEGIVWLKYSHDYSQQNATIVLPKFVNSTDCLIDGTHTNPQLREAVIEIVNEVAQGKYDPNKGVQKFLRRFKQYVTKHLQNHTENDPYAHILRIYSSRIDQVLSQVKKPGYFDTLLGLKLAGHQRENLLRDIVYKKRYQLIQYCNAKESAIAKIIFTAQNALIGRKTTTLKNLDYRLRYVLLEDVDPFFKRTLQRLLCTSLEQLQATYQKDQKRLRAFEKTSRIEKFRRDHVESIQKLKNDIAAKFQEISDAELQYRSELFKELREKLNLWSQKTFSQNFKKAYPQEPMSPAMVSRLEQRARTPMKTKYTSPLNQRKKELDLEKGKKVASVFGIDPGLFLPGLVTSNY